jgi:hypothetical protein
MASEDRNVLRYVSLLLERHGAAAAPQVADHVCEALSLTGDEPRLRVWRRVGARVRAAAGGRG